MTRFCPICGKADSSADFIGEFCAACASKRIAPLPPVRLTFCTKCGKLLDKARKVKDVLLGDEAIRILKLRSADAVFDAAASTMTYDSPFGRITQPVLILTDKNICNECGRSGTQYFEAIIQLRGHEKKVERMSTAIITAVQEKSFVPKVMELKEGIDIYCGSRNEAISSLNKFELSYVRTEKLAGERNGKRLYRTTLLVRL